MNLKDKNNYYFIGLGGIGVSAIARLFLAAGKNVSGSDMRDSIILRDLENLGAQVFIGHSVENIKNDLPDVVIFSEDISADSAGYTELKYLQDQKVESLTYAQALGLLMEGHFGIAVTGTNGKSTTSALLALILDRAGFDPSVVIGSKISPLNSTKKFTANARLGNGKYFVAEADEYHRHMLEINPNMIVVTNIAEDHLDYYKDLDEIKSVFEEYILKLPETGYIIYNADDKNTVEVGIKAHCHKLTFGIEHYADLQALNIQATEGRQTFDFHYKDEFIGKCTIHVPGRFNISNVLGATLTALKLGVGIDVILKTMEEFNGIWRRFEKVGEFNGKTVISDYAHHPAGVAATIGAAKQFFPGKRILTVFQPHHRNRTKKLFGEFVRSLVQADYLLVPEIFDVAGREHGEQISSRDLVGELRKLQVEAEFMPDLRQTENWIKDKADNFDVILLMGAGDIDLMARKLV